MASAHGVIVLGARRDGHANVVRAVIERAGGAEIVGFLDDDPRKHGGEIAGIPVLGDMEKIGTIEARHFVVGVGDSAARRRLYQRALEAGLTPWTAVDPSATLLPGVRIGGGSVIVAGAVVNVGAVLGANVLVNTAATVDHNVVLADHVTVGPGCHLGGRVVVEEGAYLGLGAVVLPDVRIGRDSVVGAGAVVVQDVAAGTVVAGCPARYRRDVNKET